MRSDYQHTDGSLREKKKFEFSAEDRKPADEIFCSRWETILSLSLSLSLSFMGNILLIMSSHTCTGTFRSDSTHTSASTISREIKFESSPDSHARSSGARRDSRAGVLLQTNIFLLACPTKHGMSLTRALGAHAPRRPVENRDIRHTARERGVSGTSRVHAITRILSRGVYYYTRLSPDYWKK